MKMEMYPQQEEQIDSSKINYINEPEQVPAPIEIRAEVQSND
jgi:hypothetical protein